MLVGQFRDFTTSGRTLNETLLDEERLIDLLDGASIFTDRRGYGVDAHGSSLELVDDYAKYLVVNLIQAILIDVQGLQRIARYAHVYPAVTLHLGKVTHPSEQGIGNTWRATAAAGNLACRHSVYGESQDAGRTLHDAAQGGRIIIFKVHIDAKAGAQGCREQTTPGGSSHKGKRCQVNLDAACRWSLVYHDVYAIVLHSRIEILLHHRREAVYLVDEKDIIGLQRGKDTRQVPRLVQNRSAGQLEPHSQFVGNDVREGRLTQSRRPVQQRMVKRFPAELGRINEDFQVLHHFLLTGKVPELQRAQGILKVLLALRTLFSDIKIVFHGHKGRKKILYYKIFGGYNRFFCNFALSNQNHPQ